MQQSFVPEIRTVGHVHGHVTIQDLANEVGMYSATPVFACQYGGPIVRHLLNQVPRSFYDQALSIGLHPNIIVRIHRLQPGDYPAFPGWHCDGEYREDYHSQPDLSRIPRHSHITATVSTVTEGVSLTQFLAEPCTLEITDDEPVWTQVHRQVERIRPQRIINARDGELTEFGSLTLHRAMPAKIRGWRLFFRISMWHKPNLGGGGLLAKQEQIYRLAEEGGW